jgi:hypothetical protein
MIVVRDVFQLKFGQAREVVALLKDSSSVLQRTAGVRPPDRLLTDLVGKYYTLVLETTYGTLAEYEGEMQRLMGSDDWRQWYARVVPHVVSGYREILKIVD